MVDLNDQRLAPAERPERHHRDDGPGLPRPDDRLRPLPRPQVRPDPPGRLLPAPGVLHPGPVPRRPTRSPAGRAGGVRARTTGSAEVARGPGRPCSRSRSRSAALLDAGAARRASTTRRSPAFEKPAAERTPREVAAGLRGLGEGQADQARSLAGRARPVRPGGRGPRCWPRLDRAARPAEPQPAAGPGDRRGGPEPPPTYPPEAGRATPRGPEVAPAFPAVLGRPATAGRDDRPDGPARPAAARRWPTG